jgi:xylan 1,4-beta-xylosidase
MFGMMPGNRVEVKSGLAYDYVRVRDESVRAEADINALASKDAKSAAVMVWNYHDDNLPAPDAPGFDSAERFAQPESACSSLPHRQGNSATPTKPGRKWARPNPTAEQIAELEKAGQLKQLSAPESVSVKAVPPL